MCGIVGVAGLVWRSEAEVFSELLFLDQLRGQHSTGVWVLDKSNKGKMYKSVGNTFDFWREHREDWPKGIFKENPQLMLGHNRFATQGEITKENAHPFEFENLIGVHNGTVDKNSLKELADSEKFDMDSKKIYAQLNSDPDVKKLWEKADGPMALVWFDRRDNRLHFLRNEKRPLSYALSKDNKTIFWASDDDMLEYAFKRSKLVHNPILSVEVNVHHIIRKEDNNNIVVEKVPVTPFVKKYSTNHYHGGGFGNEAYWREYDHYRNSGNFKGHKTVKAKARITICNFVENTEAGLFKGFFLARNVATGMDGIVTLPLSSYASLYKKIMSAGNKSEYLVDYSDMSFKTEKNSNYNYFNVSASKIGPPVAAHQEVKVIPFRPKEVILPTKETIKEKDEIVEYAAGFNDEQWTEEEFERNCVHGCLQCKIPLSWGDREDILWLSPSTPVCGNCKWLPEIVELNEEVQSGLLEGKS
jgi:hypothetical protein